MLCLRGGLALVLLRGAAAPAGAREAGRSNLAADAAPWVATLGREEERLDAPTPTPPAAAAAAAGEGWMLAPAIAAWGFVLGPGCAASTMGSLLPLPLPPLKVTRALPGGAKWGVAPRRALAGGAPPPPNPLLVPPPYLPLPPTLPPSCCSQPKGSARAEAGRARERAKRLRVSWIWEGGVASWRRNAVPPPPRGD